MDGALGSEVVDLVRLESLHDREERRLIEEVGTGHLDVVAQVLDATSGKGAGSSRHPDNRIAELEEVLGRDSSPSCPVMPVISAVGISRPRLRPGRSHCWAQCARDVNQWPKQ